MDKAYSVLDIKSVEETGDYVTVKGIATTPATDRVGDVVEPLGAKFKTPMPLLWQHRHAEPVGQVTFAKATKDGIPFEARLPIIREAGKLKDRVDEAIQSVKYGLVSAVSIGFSAVEGAVERLKTGGLRFVEWEWHELSLVTIPANSQAVITALKSAETLASAGDERPAVAADSSGHRKTGPVSLKPRGRKPIQINVTRKSQ